MNCFSIQFGLLLRLRELARVESIEVEEDVHLRCTLRYKNEDLKHLEAAFDSYPANSKQSEGHVSFIEAADRTCRNSCGCANDS